MSAEVDIATTETEIKEIILIALCDFLENRYRRAIYIERFIYGPVLF
jgi:hypothetical protein